MPIVSSPRISESTRQHLGIDYLLLPIEATQHQSVDAFIDVPSGWSFCEMTTASCDAGSRSPQMREKAPSSSEHDEDFPQSR